MRKPVAVAPRHLSMAASTPFLLHLIRPFHVLSRFSKIAFVDDGTMCIDCDREIHLTASTGGTNAIG